MDKTFVYKRGDKYSVTCVVDVHGFVSMHNEIYPKEASSDVVLRFLEEAEQAAIAAASKTDANVQE
jgi:hypothetical protein